MLDNGIIRVVIGDRGQITSLIDYASGREAIAPGAVGNRLQLHRDIPNLWDAWDVDEHYRRNVTEIDHVDALDLDSENDQAVVRVRRILRLLDDRAADHPASGFGVGRDPQRHRLARAEEAAQARFRLRRARRPVGLRDPVRSRLPPHPHQHVLGVRPVRDLRPPVDPGRRTRLRRGGQQRLHLRPRRRSYDARASAAPPPRSDCRWCAVPATPTPQADQGRHTSRVTVRPGATIADAVEEGYRTNLPLRHVTGERGVRPLVSISNPAIVVEAVKLAEDRSGDVVVRLYESLGGHAVGELSANFPVSAVTFTDLLERPAAYGASSATSTEVRLDLRPFEIVTVRLARG